MRLSFVVAVETIELLKVITDGFFILCKGLSASGAIQCLSFLSVF